jgi:hypothetical protein
MQRIIHRINTVSGLLGVPREFGVELDVRDFGGKLVLCHEPHRGGELFSDYCEKFDHALMVVDVKSEGVEEEALAVLEKSGIGNFFFLGLSFPSVVRLSGAGETRIAVRFSQYEPVEACLAARGMAEWAWVDTFTRLPLDRASCAKLKGAGFKTCLVCPERWGRPQDIAAYRRRMERGGFETDAVMTSLAHAAEWG